MRCWRCGSNCSPTACCSTIAGLPSARRWGWQLSASGTWFLRVISDRTQRRFRERVTVALESHVARLQASVVSIEHHERPEFLNRLAMLRDQVFVLDHMYMSLFSTCGWILRLGVTLVLLISIHPALALLAFFALPTVFTSTWRPGVERAAEEAVRAEHRLARHLFVIATTAPPGKEVRVTGIGQRLVARATQAWERWYAPVAKARWGSAWWHTLAWAIFGAGSWVRWRLSRWCMQAAPGNVLLVLAAGSRLSAYIGATVGEIGFLRGIWLDGSRRLAWLEDYAAALAEHCRRAGAREARERDSLRARLVRLSGHGAAGARGCVPGTQAGHGGGHRGRKRRGQDHAGEALVPDVRAHERSHSGGRNRALPACRRRRGGRGLRERFRISSDSSFRRSIRWESGMCPDLTMSRAVVAAVEQAGASDVVDQLADGLETQLGATWPLGVEVSFGQWQKLALARGFMRDQPLVLVLDEPTAALDAETEHALFERFAAAARDGRSNGADDEADGRITILVSHRFSTVRMADLIVVLDGSRVVEVGLTRELVAKGGQYAELYGIQAAAYR